MKKSILALALNLVIISACADQFIYCPVAMNCAGDTCTVSDNVSGFWPNSIQNIYNLNGNYALAHAQALIISSDPAAFNVGCTYMNNTSYPITIGIYVMNTKQYGPALQQANTNWSPQNFGQFDCDVIGDGSGTQNCPLAIWSMIHLPSKR